MHPYYPLKNMGASYHEESAYTDSKVDATEVFKALQQEALKIHGDRDGYPGSFYGINGWTWLDVPMFKDFSVASDWISENTEKWGNGIAVKVSSGKKSNRKREKCVKEYEYAIEEVNKAETQHAAEVKNLLTNYKNEKKLYKCKMCKSSLNCEYLSNIVCPLCKNTFGISKTVKKIDKLKKKISKTKQRMENEHSNYYWLMGGWSAE